jgi:adenylate kinase
MNIVMIGPPGSGKGTQAVFLAERLLVNHFSSGAFLRKSISLGENATDEVSKSVTHGTLVPDEQISEIVLPGILDLCKTGGVCIDGFPRTVRQAQLMIEFFAHHGVELDAVIHLAVPQDEVMRRLSGRQSCSNCGRSYHIQGMPPKKAGVCDECGGGLTVRKDDSVEVIQKRLDVYKDLTEPVVDFMKQHGFRVITVDGASDRSVVGELILEKVGEI